MQTEPRGRAAEVAGRSQAARHHALDALRGLAALAVANYHFLFYGLNRPVQSMGTFTVYLFFAISALTMMMVYGPRFADGIDYASASRFYRARAARILPLLILVSLISVTLQHSRDAAVHAYLTASGAFLLGPPGYLAIGNGTWSLGIELAFYLVFPIAALVLARWPTRRLALVLASSLLAQQLYLSMIGPWLAGDPLRHWDYYISPLTFAPFFLIGFLVHRLPDRTSAWALLPMVLLLLGVVAGSLLYRPNLFTSPVAYLAFTLLVALSLVAAWRAKTPEALRPLATFLGEISYSLYLLHWFVFIVLRKFAPSLPPPAFWAAFMALSLAAAWICNRIFEVPLRRRLGTPRPAGG